MQQQQALQNLLGIGLRPQYEAYYRPGDEAGSFAKNLAEQLLTKENFQGLGEIANWARQRRSSANAGSLGMQASDVNFEPINTISPTSSLGSFNAMSNPSNLVAGISAPNNARSMTTMPTTNIAALKALYGI